LNTDEKINGILSSQDEMDKRIFTFPTSQIRLNGRKSSYFEIISSLSFEECNKALRRIVERFDMEEIEKLIENTAFISEIRKEFYKKIIQQRFDKILLASYQKLKL
jgi:glutamyl-tRNA reductase